MDITMSEQQYQTLRRALAAGQIDRTAFIAAVDKLGFQDRWGRYWNIGSETGRWYYYDGQNWQQSDPRQADRLPFTGELGRCWQRGDEDQAWYGYQPETGQWLKSDRTPPSTPLATPPLTTRTEVPWSKQMGLWFGLACALILAWLVFMPVSSASPHTGPLPAPSPRPPLGGGGGSSGGGGGNGGSGQEDDSHGSAGPTGAIVGQVTDLSTGSPGAGLEVEVSGQIVRTDTDGSYSITGLPAGQYRVSPKLNGQGVPAQGPIYASVDGVNRLEVDLSYYSQPPAAPTYPVQPAAVQPVAVPPALPPSGADLIYRPWLLSGLGLLLIVAGGLGQKKAARYQE